MLTGLGGCEPQLEVHLNASLNVGLTPTQIVEAITHTAVYCGIPKALNAIFVAKRVFAERPASYRDINERLTPIRPPQADPVTAHPPTLAPDLNVDHEL